MKINIPHKALREERDTAKFLTILAIFVSLITWPIVIGIILGIVDAKEPTWASCIGLSSMSIILIVASIIKWRMVKKELVRGVLEDL